MPKNLRTSLKTRRRNAHSMDDYDRLPCEVRRWLSAANLPWSPKSTLNLWHKALRQHDGDAQAALAYLNQCETAKMKKDAPRVWGTSYPMAEA